MSDECRDAFEKPFNILQCYINSLPANPKNAKANDALYELQDAHQARQQEIDQLVAALRIEHEKVIDLECMHHWTESLEKHYERINEKVGSDCSVCNLLAKYREARDA